MAVVSSLLYLPSSFPCILTESATSWEVFPFICALPKILSFGFHKSCQFYQHGVCLLQYTVLKGWGGGHTNRQGSC